MKIGIDIDETITDTDEVLLSYAKANNMPIKGSKCGAWPNGFWDNYAKDIYPKVKLKPDVKEVFDWLKANHHEIIIITARGYYNHQEVKKITEDFFKENNLPYDKLIMSTHNKGRVAEVEKIDLFIDDLTSNLDNVSAYDIESIKVTKEINPNSKYKEFTSWLDILAYIKLLNKGE